MMSRRNVISVCVVIVVIVILIIVLVSTKTSDNNAYDNNSTDNIYSMEDDTYNVNNAGGNDMMTGHNGDEEHIKDWQNEEQDNQYMETANNDTGHAYRHDSGQKYVIRDIGDGIAIYRCIVSEEGETEEFYDYAAINTENYPEDIAESLESGIELYGDKELYEFLQAYSS